VVLCGEENILIGESHSCNNGELKHKFQLPESINNFHENVF
jgi:hypothetical protein